MDKNISFDEPCQRLKFLKTITKNFYFGLKILNLSLVRTAFRIVFRIIFCLHKKMTKLYENRNKLYSDRGLYVINTYIYKTLRKFQVFSSSFSIRYVENSHGTPPDRRLHRSVRVQRCLDVSTTIAALGFLAYLPAKTNR